MAFDGPRYRTDAHCGDIFLLADAVRSKQWTREPLTAPRGCEPALDRLPCQPTANRLSLSERPSSRSQCRLLSLAELAIEMRRREFLGAAAAALAATRVRGAPRDPRPNFLLIVADDM